MCLNSGGMTTAKILILKIYFTGRMAKGRMTECITVVLSNDKYDSLGITFLIKLIIFHNNTILFLDW